MNTFNTKYHLNYQYKISLNKTKKTVQLNNILMNPVKYLKKM